MATRKSILYEAAHSDVVVILRRTYSYPFFRLLRFAAKYLVFDYDDAVFQKDQGQQSNSRERSFIRSVASADQVWPGNNYLADRARPFARKILVLPTSLDIDKYNFSVDREQNFFDLVWIGSSATKEHLKSVLPALESAAGVIPALRLKIIADFTLQSDKLTIVPIRWSEKREAQELAAAHIGIAPLPDNLFTRGKCALKVIQYMAAGLPVISSPTGVNKEIVEHGVNGFLVAGEQEWLTAIERLVADDALRNSMGKAGRKRCFDNFSLQSTFRKMIASLENGLAG
ncbi:MAG: glycosyltransferase family 4 protein [Proteobacteria bacterium]|nr:glycosyltransferase family 4 protein [Pseudomonadota bacterium]MBU4294848.1 glycosyltransferase family 4 protein [Pseudomonadota bacterium]MCG2749350.1 glycosyltransferase family 4 protein [Desulfobulbaceae bacterium]